MEIKINRAEKEVLNKNPRYIIDAEFMFGDADGYENIIKTVPENEIESYKPYINALEACSSAYPHGKGGDDGYDHIFEFNLFFEADPEEDIFDFAYLLGFSKEEIEEFENDEDGDKSYEIISNRLCEYRNKVNPHNICEYAPTYEGYHHSFCGYAVTFIDEDGTEFPCDINFTDKENARFEEIKKLPRRW